MDATRQPPVSVIVPLKGTAGVAAGLRSLCAQDYSDYELILVTESSDDPAVAVIGEVLRGLAKVPCRHVVAGRSAACGQKNHNLLAGIQASDPARPVLVFCDGGHVAPLDWLGSLVEPITRGDAEVATGYHRIAGRPFNVVSAALAMVVSVLRTFQRSAALRQPWGGSTAIHRSLFERLHVAEHWSRHVVDDVSLARLLAREGLGTAWAETAILQTDVQRPCLRQFTAWLTRQLFFLRLYYPGTWLAGGVAGWGLTLALVGLTACGLAGLIQGSWPWPGALACLLPAFVFCGIALRLRRDHPNPGPVHLWLGGACLAAFAACACHLRTVRVRQLVWRGIRYTVARDGQVTGIARS